MYTDDYMYLMLALDAGGACAVTSPAARASLQKCGYMVPAKVRYNGYRGGRWIQHAMALTKRGQQRALEIDKATRSQRSKEFMKGHLHRALDKRTIEELPNAWWYDRRYRH